MNADDFKNDLDITISNAVERGVDLYKMVGILEYFKLALIRSMQDVASKENEQPPS